MPGPKSMSKVVLKIIFRIIGWRLLQWNPSFKSALTFSNDLHNPKKLVSSILYKMEPLMRDHPSFKTTLWGGLKREVPL